MCQERKKRKQAEKRKRRGNTSSLHITMKGKKYNHNPVKLFKKQCKEVKDDFKKIIGI